MKPTGLPGAKKRSAADERAKAIKLATSKGSCRWVRAASRAVSTAVFRADLGIWSYYYNIYIYLEI
jgi:hypothetical protein